MRSLLIAFFVLLVIVVAPMLLAAPVYSVTLTNWANSPNSAIRVGDKLFTLISTDFNGANNVQMSAYNPTLYALSLQPVSPYNQLNNTTKHLTYKVTIVDDPATLGNEALLNFFNRVSWDGNRYIASGSFTVTGVFDDNADFSSPLFTISNSATPSGLYVVPGLVQALFVRLTYTATGITLLTSHTITYEQKVDTIPVEDTSWGQIKELYR